MGNAKKGIWKKSGLLMWLHFQNQWIKSIEFDNQQLRKRAGHMSPRQESTALGTRRSETGLGARTAYA